MKISVSFETRVGEVTTTTTLCLEGMGTQDALVFFREWLTLTQGDKQDFAPRLFADAIKLEAAATTLDTLTETLKQQ